jgi:predicted histone-like DNA-binding protein
MSIRFKVQEKGQPGVAGGGQKKFYAAIATDGEVTIDELVKDIEKFSSLTEPDIRGVIMALENVIQDKLAQSKIIRLEKLGSLYPAISSTGADKAEDVTAKNIKDVSVNYRPGIRILQALEMAGFKKAN